MALAKRITFLSTQFSFSRNAAGYVLTVLLASVAFQILKYFVRFYVIWHSYYMTTDS